MRDHLIVDIQSKYIILCHGAPTSANEREMKPHLLTDLPSVATPPSLLTVTPGVM